jgi:hypothetical protein
VNFSPAIAVGLGVSAAIAWVVRCLREDRASVADRGLA